MEPVEHPTSPTAASRQFSLRQMMITVSGIAAVLALPGGVALVALLMGSVGVAILILVVLMLFQFPLFVLVSMRIRRRAEESK